MLVMATPYEGFSVGVAEDIFADGYLARNGDSLGIVQSWGGSEVQRISCSHRIVGSRGSLDRDGYTVAPFVPRS